MAKLRDLIRNLEKEQEAYHEKASKLTAAQIADEVAKFKKLRAEISETICEGAKDCEGGHRPLGMFMEGTPKPFVIGDPAVRDRRVRAALQEDAVEDWNAGNYLPPREPETVVATHRDATGKVKSQREIKLRRAK